MKCETVKLSEGDRIDVIKESIGYSINGPAIVVVLKEKSATEVTADEIMGPRQLGSTILD